MREAPFGRAEAGLESRAPGRSRSPCRSPCSVTAKQAYVPAARCRSVHAMKRSKPSTVVGGGEMKRDTSSVVSSAKSDGASDARSSRSVDLLAAQHRQPLPPVGADDRRRGRGVVRTGVGHDGPQFVAVRHLFHDYLPPFGRWAIRRSVSVARCPRRCCRRRGGAPHDVVAIGGAPHDVVAVVRSRCPTRCCRRRRRCPRRCCRSRRRRSRCPTRCCRRRRVPQTMLSPSSRSSVPQTMLSPSLESVPQTMLSPSLVGAPDDVVAVVGAASSPSPTRRRGFHALALGSMTPPPDHVVAPDDVLAPGRRDRQASCRLRRARRTPPARTAPTTFMKPAP